MKNESIVASMDAQTEQQAAHLHPVRRAFLAGALALGIGGGAAVIEAAPVEAAVHAATAADCSPIEFGHPSSNSGNFNTEAFLPKTGNITNEKGVQKYINNLFSNGPIANKTDKASLAAVMAAVVEPANDGAATDPNYDYENAFVNKAQAYNAPGGKKAAQEDCETSLNTLNQVASYDSSWEQKGATVTEFKAVRNKDNDIVGMKLEQRVTNKALKGIKLALPKTAKGLDGFTEVLISTNEKGHWDGTMFIKGVTKGNTGAAVGLNGQEVKDTTPKEKPQNQENNNLFATGGSGNQNANNGGGTFGTSNGNGESNQPGNVPESGGNGGSTPGTVPSFGPGTTTPGTTPPETTPPATTPPTRPPETVPPTTPPTAPPTTRPPVTTLPPKDPPAPTLPPPTGF